MDSLREEGQKRGRGIPPARAARLSKAAGRIARQLFAVASVGYGFRPEKTFVKANLIEILERFEDEDMVATVVLELLERHGQTFSIELLTPRVVASMLRGCEIAKDAWPFERWFRTLPVNEVGDPKDPELYGAAELWLGYWRDGYRNGDSELARKARRRLTELRDRATVPEEVEEWK